MRCAILQPSYIPWRGYFHQIQSVDVFVFYDDVQYDKHGWRNRNRVKTANGARWLTIPVHSKGNVTQRILTRDIEISWNEDWARKHRQTLAQAYARAPFFERYASILHAAFERRPRLLCDLTIPLTIELAAALGLSGKRFLRSSELRATGDRTGRLLAILKELGATDYLSGPSAREYIDPGLFQREGIGLGFMTYDYPEYDQLHPPFDPQVSIVDLLFMQGPEAGRFIWGRGG